MRRLAIPAALIAAATLLPAPAHADTRPGVWWIVPQTATITQGDYPRPTAWTLGGIEYGVADNGHLYADGADLGTPDAVECATETVVVQQAPRLRAKVQELRAKVRHLRARLRGAR